VCKGNPDSNPKFIIPSSSSIVQYFTPGNVETLLGGDLAFLLKMVIPIVMEKEPAI